MTTHTASLEATVVPATRDLGDGFKVPLGPRYLWWNFVSSSKERIEQAKMDWKAGRFRGVPGDPEFIPLPL